MILRIILVALRNLLRQPFRTLLILQGVIWGTALGVFPPAVINGSMKQVETQAGRLGTDRLLITQEGHEAGSRFDWSLAERLRRERAAMVRHVTCFAVLRPPTIPFEFAWPGPAGVVRSVFIPFRLPVPTSIATDADALGGRGLRIESGRFFTADEIRAGRKVCVAEHNAAGSTGQRLSLGDVVRLVDGRELQVIGVTAARAADGEVLDEFGYLREHPLRRLLDEMKQYVGIFDDPELAELTRDNAVMVPHALMPDVRPNWIEIRARPQDVLALKSRLQNDLSGDGYEPVIYANAILPVLYGETIKTAIELNRAIFLLCVVVGTSVVCTIMILSVVERQREIAIRRVEGARRWHIALQFVVETGTLCAVGAVAGVPLGLALAAARCALEPMAAVTWTLPGAEASVFVAITTAIGLAGGLLPAWRAMRVDPVEMLRYE